MLLALMILAGFVANSNTAPFDPPAPTCETVMTDGGLTPEFSNSVAHRLHSLTLEDLRYYFNPDAREENNIPTVNLDLNSDIRVLPNTPLYGYDTSFTSVGMRHLDQVLRNIDRENYGITNLSPLEQLAHVLHMSELWSRARIHYNTLALLPPSSGLCACVRDTHNNGVLAELQLLAYKIKYPGITAGGYTPGNVSYDFAYSFAKVGPRTAPEAYDFTYSFLAGSSSDVDARADRARALKEFDFEGDEDDVVARVASDLVDGDKGSDVHLDNEGSWRQWRDGFKAMQEYANYEFAVFIFCAMNP